jgi:ABC-type oligopeptide transport system ATPase subunit
MTLLEIRDLTVGVVTEDAERELVRELSLDLEQGRTLCVVGESGSGKTVTALSIIRLLEFVAPVRTRGEIAIDGVDVTKLPADAMRAYRGPRIGMIFQEALDSLNPGRGSAGSWSRPTAKPGRCPGRRLAAAARCASGPRPRPAGCSPKSGSPTPTGSCACTRTRCPAECSSA